MSFGSLLSSSRKPSINQSINTSVNASEWTKKLDIHVIHDDDSIYSITTHEEFEMKEALMRLNATILEAKMANVELNGSAIPDAAALNGFVQLLTGLGNRAANLMRLSMIHHVTLLFRYVSQQSARFTE